MKKGSKLFLIVSAAIFVAGILICLVGASVSASEGNQLYAAEIGDGRGYTYEFGDGETDKIKISVTDADINIYGGCERSYIEVINFNENLCSYTGNNAIITFREASEVDDITGIWDSGLSFKGLRYVLRPTPKDDKKTVNIYLEKSEHVKVFELSINKGNVTISDLDTVTDYKIDMESGKVSLSCIKTGSAVKIEAKGDVSTDISFASVRADIVEIKAKRAKFIADGFSFDKCDINVTTGSANFGFEPLNAVYTVDIATMGKLTVDGEVRKDRYKYPESEEPSKKPQEGDEEEKISSLVINGSDFFVMLDTPLAEAEKITE